MKKQLKKFPFVGLIPLLLTLITSSWVADGLKGEALFSGWHPVFEQWRIHTVLTSLVLFFLSFMWLYHYRRSFIGVRTLQQIKTTPCKALVLMVSKPNFGPLKKIFPLRIDANTELKGESLKDDIFALYEKDVQCNWRPILKGLIPHEQSLKYLYLIGSQTVDGVSGSFEVLEDVEFLIKRYFPHVKTFKSKEGVNFEDLEALIQVIYEAIKELKREELTEEDIVIDITGGQKTTSIAGAVVTLNSSVRFQYVQTNKPYDVISYDLTIQSETSI